jgi:hypothetical protein
MPHDDPSALSTKVDDTADRDARSAVGAIAGARAGWSRLLVCALAKASHFR